MHRWCFVFWTFRPIVLHSHRFQYSSWVVWCWQSSVFTLPYEWVLPFAWAKHIKFSTLLLSRWAVYCFPSRLRYLWTRIPPVCPWPSSSCIPHRSWTTWSPSCSSNVRGRGRCLFRQRWLSGFGEPGGSQMCWGSSRRIRILASLLRVVLWFHLAIAIWPLF